MVNKIIRDPNDDSVTVRAIIELEDGFLVQGYPDSFKTKVTLGGHVRKGESLWEALKRELWEEAKVEILIEEIRPSTQVFENYYYILSSEDISKPQVGRWNQDGGRVEVVTYDELISQNEKKQTVPIITSDRIAIRRYLKRGVKRNGISSPRRTKPIRL